MSKLPDSLRQDFINNADDKDYRHGYADESLNISIATQLKVLREQREWRQEDLAEEAQMQQSMISRYENVNYSSWSINTLRKFAIAFDVWLDVRFRSFGELVKTTEQFSRESLQVPCFADDPLFKVGRKVLRPKIRATAQTVRRLTPFVVQPRETGATQLPFQWDLVGGSDLRPQLVNSSPRPQGSAVIDRIMQASAGAGRSYANG